MDKNNYIAIGTDSEGKFVFKEVPEEYLDEMFGTDDNITYLREDDFEQLRAAMSGGEPPKHKQYRVACFMRVDPEEDELMTLEDAKSEIESLSLMQPENRYDIEKVDDEAE